SSMTEIGGGSATGDATDASSGASMAVGPRTVSDLYFNSRTSASKSTGGASFFALTSSFTSSLTSSGTSSGSSGGRSFATAFGFFFAGGSLSVMSGNASFSVSAKSSAVSKRSLGSSASARANESLSAASRLPGSSVSASTTCDPDPAMRRAHSMSCASAA